MEIAQRTLGKFSKDRIAPLFATRRLGLMSTPQSISSVANSPSFGDLGVKRLGWAHTHCIQSLTAGDLALI